MKQTHLHAFSLVEVTMALGVSTFCLLAIFGLLPVGMKSNQAAIEQTVANGILSAAAADLRATACPAGLAVTSQQFGLSIPASSSSNTSVLYFSETGKSETAQNAASRYRLTASFSSDTSSATNVSLIVSWPPSLKPAEAAGSCQIFLALDRN
jgi:uncharacterized protein (TIGR02598 family)